MFYSAITTIIRNEYSIEGQLKYQTCFYLVTYKGVYYHVCMHEFSD